ncbi:hypothetical protein HYPSUDRAFT_49184 [Hypholoma sublateritium FD-334 SS-4]|uniref:GLTSCR protein conserved domain-containing protein n=1 Tax=Hypholoma sublateritium (strain FD-334 SS-4) TaxID=945553 RepID=A0A0D2KIE0_HYPSF|nr:hypothetical protein HYPSUDRAFT_49184 [Hypholoma sublateritium FD-334 SS-4]
MSKAYNSQPHQNSTNAYFPSAGTYVSNDQATSSLDVPYKPYSDQPLQFTSLNASVSVSEDTPTTTQSVNENKTPEELESMVHTHERLNICIANDHNMVAHPDMDSPFLDASDVIKRLLPYHIFQQPRVDLSRTVSGKGKEKALETDWKKEIHATKLALRLVQRREAIRDRWRKLKIRSAKRSSPDDQAYYLAQVILDSDRSENAWITNELRTARTEAERFEREKRASTNVSRTSQFTSASQTPLPTMQTQYYRAYPYAYTQAYGSPVPAPTMSTFPVAPPPAASAYTPYQTSSAIPVQLPVASLPALHALGIIPVPAASLPPESQQQPPAVLRGSTANGTILSLEINVSLLQSAQMSGLAMVLNSLVSRSNAVGASGASGPAPAAPKGTDASPS